MVKRFGAGIALIGAATLMAGCGGGNGTDTKARNIVYVGSNNPNTNQNSILAYSRAADGTLTVLPGSPFALNGTGGANPNDTIPEDDLDQQVVVTADSKFLIAVNSGSDTIAVMTINRDGSLQHVAGSPFASGGIQPVSVGVRNYVSGSGGEIYVVNRNQPQTRPAGANGNYTAFRMSATGQLTAISGSTINTVTGASPSQALMDSKTGLMFTAEQTAAVIPNPTGPVRSFRFDSAGIATPVSALIPPANGPLPPFAVGLAVHPSQNVLYVGFVTYGQVGVYSYDSSGTLTFVRAAASSGKAVCWLRTNATGTRLYSANAASNTISVYDTTNPLNPVEIQHFALRDPGADFALPAPFSSVFPTAKTSQCFQISLSPDGASLYVVCHTSDPNPGAFDGNRLHTLTINPTDGTIAEPAADLLLGVPADANPGGIAVI